MCPVNCSLLLLLLLSLVASLGLSYKCGSLLLLDRPLRDSSSFFMHHFEAFDAGKSNVRFQGFGLKIKRTETALVEIAVQLFYVSIEVFLSNDNVLFLCAVIALDSSKLASGLMFR